VQDEREPDVTTQIEPLAPGAAGDEVLVHQLAQLINGAYAAGENGLWLEGTTRITAAEVARTIAGGGMLVATFDGGVVGCGHVRPLDPATAVLGLVSVAPQQWGGGVGRELVRSAEELARSRGVTAMQLELLVPRGWVHPEKDRLRAWYLRLGYEVVRSAPIEEILTHAAAARLVTPCEFLVFRRSLAD
jgi:GNAT superfamily N-acetyltransferase